MKQKYLIAAGCIIALLAISFYVYDSSNNTNKGDIYAKTTRGDLEISVTTTGELDAKSSVKIQGPRGIRNAQIWRVKIASIVPEGTLVEKGQVIAQLDKSELMDKLKQKENELIKVQSEYTTATLDTALTLREARDQLINLSFEMEQKKLELEQSAYEPPATIKQVEIALSKAKRDYNQAKENYAIKEQQAIAKVKSSKTNLIAAQSEAASLRTLVGGFTIKAPEKGMLIYERERNGNKKKEGSDISAWNPVVAQLPNLTSMVSRTYVNEVDIRKIKKGQNVRIGLDAFPDKQMTGKVVGVANVGEQKPNTDAKVFEVEVLLEQSDTTLRPAMTTSNVIVADVRKNCLHIPLEALHVEGDSITYVFAKSGISYTKQQVFVGETNDQDAEITSGLTEGQEVLLSVPKGGESKEMILISNAKAPGSDLSEVSQK